MYYLFEEYIPKIYFLLAALRTFLLRPLFKEIGFNTHIQYGCFFNGMKNIRIGRNVYINHHTELLARNVGIDIGNDVMIGQHSILITDNHNFDDPNKKIIDQGSSYSKIVIEDNVWLGSNVTILSGVTVGSGSVVAAGAVVTKNIEPNSVVGGIPAKFIKKRVIV